jgi:hypothetical protein
MMGDLAVPEQPSEQCQVLLAGLSWHPAYSEASVPVDGEPFPQVHALGGHSLYVCESRWPARAPTALVGGPDRTFAYRRDPQVDRNHAEPALFEGAARSGDGRFGEPPGPGVLGKVQPEIIDSLGERG